MTGHEEIRAPARRRRGRIREIKLVLPDNAYTFIEEHEDVDWSEVALKGIVRYARDLELMEKLAGEGELTKEDVEELERRITTCLARHRRERA